MSELIYGPGKIGEIIDNAKPIFRNWPETLDGLIHVSGHPAELGVETKQHMWGEEEIEFLKKAKEAEYNLELLTRVQLIIDDFDESMLKLLGHIWPMLSVNKASPEMEHIANLYEFSKQKVKNIKDKTDKDDLLTTNPKVDDWPTMTT